MNKSIKNQGFTIVELLIVVVIIAILAAIVIVAYNGLTTRANNAAAQSAANTLVKKAEAANSLAAAYPAAVADFTANTESSLAGTGLSLNASPTAANGKTTLSYQKCTTPANTNEVLIRVWNFSTNAVADFQKLGGTTCTAWGTALSGGPY